MQFQSHFGSIKTDNRVNAKMARKEGFNPTLVRLKPNLEQRIAELEGSFNPTLVRLKRNGRVTFRRPVKMFQSHFGSIKTLLVSF